MLGSDYGKKLELSRLSIGNVYPLEQITFLSFFNDAVASWLTLLIAVPTHVLAHCHTVSGIGQICHIPSVYIQA